MKKLDLTGIFLLPLLTGCAFLDFFQKKNDVVTLPETKVVIIDREVLKDCEPLPRVADNATQEELDYHKFILIERYGTCKQRHNSGISVIKKLANIKD